MRFLISILVVSALALLPAMSQAGCPADKSLGPYDDTELPKDSGWGFPISDCNSVDWDVYFTRTEKDSDNEHYIIINPNITNTSMDQYYDSRVITEDRLYHFEGTASVGRGSDTQLRIDASGNDTGFFTGIQLLAHYYNQ